MNANKIANEWAMDAQRDIERILKKAYEDGFADGLANAPKVKGLVHRMTGTEPVVAQPCVKGIDMKTLKALFLKLDEEVDEFKAEILSNHFVDKGIDTETEGSRVALLGGDGNSFRIAEEGADVCTMIATILHVLSISDKMRFDAQAHANKHNHERGRN